MTSLHLVAWEAHSKTTAAEVTEVWPSDGGQFFLKMSFLVEWTVRLAGADHAT